MISVGIDVSKGKSMVCMLKPYGEVLLSPREFSHHKDGISWLIQQIQERTDEIRVVLEATGAYHLPVVMTLAEAGIFVSIVNPLVMKKYASTTLRKGKTDKLDSLKIANFGLDNWFHLKNFEPQDAMYSELNLLGRQYAHYIEMKIDNKLALTNLLDRTMPGIKALLKSSNSEKVEKDKLADFVEEFWHFDNITSLTEEEFVIKFKEWAKKGRYHQSESKAKKIYALSQEGISTLCSSTPSTKMLVQEAVRVLKEINKTLAIILAQMQDIVKTLPEYEVVRNMNGVGDVLAPRLIAEIGDVRRFHSGSALVAYAGLDTPPYESGQFTGTKRHISKRGSPLLRKTGYEVMKCLKTSKPQEDNAVYLFILKKESEGKPKKVAKIAGLNKFLRIYYARVREIYSQE